MNKSLAISMLVEENRIHVAATLVRTGMKCCGEKDCICKGKGVESHADASESGAAS